MNVKDDLKARLVVEFDATDDELKTLDNLLRIKNEQIVNAIENGVRPSVIIENFLYHGDLGHAIDVDLLVELGIENIINVCDCPLDEQIQNRFNVLWIQDLEDNLQSNVRRCFDRTNQFLSDCRKKNVKVLVHCQAGISRSSAIVLAYLLKFDKLSLDIAFEYLLDRRSIASPNPSFLLQLIRYENELKRDLIPLETRVCNH